jgi:hypothetical protein
MKRIRIITFAMAIFSLISACKKKTSAPVTGPNASNCKPITESTQLSGNAAVYQYTYSTDGNLSSIVKRTPAPASVLLDSFAVFYEHTVHYAPGRIAGTFNMRSTAYNANIFTGLPTQADVSITLDGIEQHNYYTYLFSYDAKSRLNKVSEHTINVPNDYEYDLNIIYNDSDNVTLLSYQYTTGPNVITNIPASGYDTKKNPYSAIKNWPLFMHADWANYDPEPVFDALSKNNLTGYVGGGITRTITYQYNTKGFPVARANTNTNISGSASFNELYDFLCN